MKRDDKRSTNKRYTILSYAYVLFTIVCVYL